METTTGDNGQFALAPVAIGALHLDRDIGDLTDSLAEMNGKRRPSQQAWVEAGRERPTVSTAPSRCRQSPIRMDRFTKRVRDLYCVGPWPLIAEVILGNARP